MPAYEFEGLRPVVHPTSFVHPQAVLIGDVIVGPGCLIGPGASLRGDIGRLEVHEGANIQDNCILHCFPGKQVIVEADGHIGHGAVLHGCTIKRNAMVGMHAVIMDDVVVGQEAFVAGLAFVKAGMQIEPRTLVAGIPARPIRALRDDEIVWKTQGTGIYQELTRRYLASSREVEPLTEVETNRPTLPDLGFRPKHEQ